MKALINSIVMILLVNALLAPGALTPGQDTENKKQTKAEKKAKKRLFKVQEGIFQKGTGKEAKVRVLMMDKRLIKGYVESRSDDGFVVVDKAGTKHDIAYKDVKKLKKRGIHPAGWLAIGAGAGLAVFGIAVLAVLENN